MRKVEKHKNKKEIGIEERSVGKTKKEGSKRESNNK
jgi:hypothetical protein